VSRRGELAAAAGADGLSGPVRAAGIDRARGRDTLLAGEPMLGRFLLQLWPAPLAPDAVIR
jgi:hypothetical protein